MAVFHPPVFCAVGHDEKVERPLIGELVRLRLRAGILDRDRSQGHGGISIRNRADHDYQYNPKPGLSVDGQARTTLDETPEKALVFQTLDGRAWTSLD
jgi:hypothetical protein